MNQIPDASNGQYIDQTEEAKRAREEEAAAQERMRQYQSDGQPTYYSQGGGAAQQAQGGIDPGTAMQIGSKFWGGGSAAGGSTAASGGIGTTGGGAAAGGTTAGGASSAGSASSGMMSGLVSNPYAWIAAAIIANETWQTKTNNRRHGLDGWKDRISGAVLRQDSERYSKHFFKDDMSGDKIGLGGDMNLGADFGSPMTLKKIPKDLKNSSIGKLVKKIF